MRDLLDWLETHVPGGRLQQDRDTYLARSPLREDTTPSFSVSLSKRCYHDFGTDERGTLTELASILGAEGPTWEPEDGREERTPSARAEGKRDASSDAVKLWQSGKPASEDHPYLVKKRIGAHGIRETLIGGERVLLVPAYNSQGFLVGCERIKPDGSKAHLGTKAGAFFLLGAVESGKPVVLTEGYATGASVHEATGYPNVVCFGAANVPTLAKRLREKHPDVELVAATDNDDSGRKAAAECPAGTLACIPSGAEHTDWNDTLCLAGPEEARRQFMQKLETARGKTQKPRPRIVMWNAEDLMKAELPEPKWAIPGILPEGLGILIGGPKLGKSLMSLHFAVSVAIGGRALGAFDVEQGSVLYLALEDVARRLQDRLRKMRVAANLGKLDFAVQWPRMDAGGLEELENWLKSHKDARLVIIDTLQCFRPPKKSRGDSYAEDYAVMRDLKRLADEFSVPILLVHHSNKAINHVADGGMKDFLEASLGSQAITGAVDAAIVLSRSRMSKMLTLSITGRDVEEKEVAVSVDVETLSYRVEGDPAILRVSAEQEKIVKALRERKEPMSPNEIAIYTGMKPGTVKSALSRLLQKSLVVSDRGKYTIPFFEESGTLGTLGTRGTSGTLGTDNDTVPRFQDAEESWNPDGRGDTKHPDVTVPKVPRVPQVCESDGTVIVVEPTGPKGALLPRGSLEKHASRSGVPVDLIRESLKPLLESGRIVLSGNDIYENPAKPNVEDPSEAIEDDEADEPDDEGVALPKYDGVPYDFPECPFQARGKSCGMSQAGVEWTEPREWSGWVRSVTMAADGITPILELCKTRGGPVFASVDGDARDVDVWDSGKWRCVSLLSEEPEPDDEDAAPPGPEKSEAGQGDAASSRGEDPGPVEEDPFTFMDA